MTDATAVLVDGPWRHRFVAANGSRFHVATLGPEGPGAAAPLVVLLHGFPQTWWAWRHQMPALAAAGYRVAAMDLRGAGASDKPPIGYDVPTLARDVAGVVRSLGASETVVVGHGVGGTVAWAMPALHPEITRAVATVSVPHPTRWQTRGAIGRVLGRAPSRRLAFAQLPWFPERAMTDGDLVERILVEWGAPGWADPETLTAYRAAARVPFAAHSGLETLRWLVRSRSRVDGQRFLAAVREPVTVPVLQVHGALDRCVPLALTRPHPARPARFEVVEGAGHFVPEEAPEALSGLLLDWLAGLPASGRAETGAPAGAALSGRRGAGGQTPAP